MNRQKHLRFSTNYDSYEPSVIKFEQLFFCQRQGARS